MGATLPLQVAASNILIGMPSTLESVPQEVLEHIAFHTATQSFAGPPSHLPPLLLTCRRVYQALSFNAGPCLYARIFSHAFDTASAFRRLGSHASAPRVLADELKKRWIHLKRIKARTDSRTRYAESHPSSTSLIDLLWLAYLMMLENDGKNEQQLLGFAEMDAWLMEYWFDDEGASSAVCMMLQNAWPIDDEKNAIAMWLLWFLLRPSNIMRNVTRFPHMTAIMKMAALASNHYPICHPPWTEFFPRSEAMLEPSLITHFSASHRLSPPTLAPAAILAFLTLGPRLSAPPKTSRAERQLLQFPASLSLAGRRSEDWDTNWYRSLHVAEPNDCYRICSEAYEIGSLEGVWEGIFTYTEFAVHAMLLEGGVPSLLDRCLVAHHRQTWKLREYYLAERSDSAQKQPRPLETGDPLKAHFPIGVKIQELSDSVQVQDADTHGSVQYLRVSSQAVSDGDKVNDVLILGEGHSAWGQFNLYGRIRPADGLISLVKEYVEGERGRWLYRGYLVGSVDGHISGRWRDTLSPRDVSGYEGCFVMSRRR